MTEKKLREKFEQFWMENEKIVDSNISCTFDDCFSFISSVVEETRREERKRIREALDPAFKDLSEGAKLMIQNNFPNAGGEILEDVGYMRSVVLDSLSKKG